LGHYARLSSLLGVSASQSSSLVPLHSLGVMSMHPEGTVGRLRYPLGGDRPSQTTRLALSGRRLWRPTIRRKSTQEWYFTAASRTPASARSSAPTYPTQAWPRAQTKV
jgi:hypothetical protein